ncbi:MAG: S49 family peptidase [Legionellales bacterium]|nr:S49 family peptidase [Legionellales bacterium]|tara:strand:- start:9894 stop:10859 length:966 start_codon:yes stop_codon:yes gene_type:complete
MSKADSANDNAQSQHAILEKVLQESITEQRRARRWRIFFRFFYAAIILLVILLLQPEHSKDYYNRSVPHTSVVRITGPIMANTRANAEDINESLDDAFDDKNTTALMLIINSPGGSPVQAGQVYDHLRYLRKKHPKVKTYAVCTDACASGAYYIAAGADQIFADQASLVGSIGVLMNGFGFVDTLQKLGVQRRLLTAGSEKGFLDPFSPMKPKDEAYAQTMLDTIHKQFIHAVEQGRGKRLQKHNPLLYSGLAWTGEQALPLGLVDGLGSPDYVARSVIGNDKKVDYTTSEGLLQRLATNMGTSMGKSISSSLGLHVGVVE